MARGRANADCFVSKLHGQGVFVCLRIDGHGFHAQLPTGANDTEGDFPPVSNEDFSDHAAIGLLFGDLEEGLPILNAVTVLHKDFSNCASAVSRKFVHYLHCFDNTDHSTFANLGADLYK